MWYINTISVNKIYDYCKLSSVLFSLSGKVQATMSAVKLHGFFIYTTLINIHKYILKSN